MRIADPTALAALVTSDLPLAQVPGSLCWLTFVLTLFYGNMPLSVLGRWCGVDKTTSLRGVSNSHVEILAGSGGTVISSPWSMQSSRWSQLPNRR